MKLDKEAILPKKAKSSISLYFLYLSVCLSVAILLLCIIAINNFCTVSLEHSGAVNDEYSNIQDPNIPTSPCLVCYYTFNSTHLVPELLDVNLCTHIIGGFAGVNASNFNITIDDDKIEVLKRLRAVTSSNKNLKLMLTVGGSGLSGFSAIVTNHSSRLTFVRSLMAAVKTYQLDGVDIDWEWPVLDGGMRERVQFIQLLQEIRVEFSRHKKKYLLSAAVAAVESIIDAAYYVRHLAEHVDFVNVMSYDYHFFTKAFPITDYNAPLFPNPEDFGGVLEHLNVNYTVFYWIDAGMPKEKIMLGVPTYGHSFRLRSLSNHRRHSPAAGFGCGNGGFVDYKDVCKLEALTWDNYSKVPYAYRNYDWISYDNRESVSLKANLAVELGLGGVMVYSLNADDYKGECHQGEKFPLTLVIRRILFGY